MRDMFIQSHHLGTSSSSSSGLVQPKKRKAEHYIGNSFVQQQQPVVYGSVNSSSQTEVNHASPSSNQQPFVRASTIKLLDTYQRCGQKVNHSFGFLWHALSHIRVY